MELKDRIPQEVLERLSHKDESTRIAVVGASNNPQKSGNIIVNNLKGKGYTVIPINPKEQEIAGLKVYKDVNSAPGPIHVVDFVTPPNVTKAVLKSMNPDVTDTVWFQDGSFDEEAVEYAKSKFKNVVYNACIMVVTNY